MLEYLANNRERMCRVLSVKKEKKSKKVLPEVRREDVFDTMIGADGSQKNVIERCKAAVSYPPDGLPILITGESGVREKAFWQD